MALTFLIDTSVVKRLSHPTVRHAVQPLAEAGQLARARLTDLEVGYSARNEAEWDRLTTALDAFEPLESTKSHHRRALQVQRLLAQRRQRGRKIPDLLIAAAAEEHGLTVLHYDADFDMVQITHAGPGRDYFQRRIDEGDSRQRALRSLKRRLSRVVYTRMKADSRNSGRGGLFPILPRVMMLPLADLASATQTPLGRACAGRPRALDSYQAALACRMRSYGEKPAYIAAQLSVSVSTVKRALAGATDG